MGHSRQPVVGLTAYVERARFGDWPAARSTLLQHTYVEHVAGAGGQPVLLPPVGDPVGLLDRLDALIVTGGSDVDPARYGAEPHEETAEIRGFRDEAELALVRAALDRGLPLLGICRGLQVLNVALGGTLHQHLPDLVGHQRHAPEPGVYARLPVRVRAGTRLAKALGCERVTVAHTHHQAVDVLGDGLSACAWSDEGLIEAAEADGAAFALGVQWHPEEGDDPSLFQALVAAAR